MLKDYENPDIIDEDETLEEGNSSHSPQQTQKAEGIEDKEKWQQGREEEKNLLEKDSAKEGSEPYPKKELEVIEQETDKKIVDVIKNVQDPELGVDIWSLGLIYDIKENSSLDITMTFTSPMCPYGPQIVSELKSGLKEKGYKEESIKVDVVFNPLWEPSEELKEALGMG
jgi:metal-sulfur cluster biosynthetic enzyme